MRQLSCVLLMVTGLVFATKGHCQQSQDFGDYVVHYSALNTNMLPPEVSQEYGLERSSSQALLNIAVLKKKAMNMPGMPVAANITANAINLTGQLREIEIREIREPDGATYYIGEFPVHNRENYRFTVNVTVKGEDEPLVVRFRQKFFTE